MKIEINENYMEQTVEVDGKIFKITRCPQKVNWNCLNCGCGNCNDDDYLRDHFVECEECGNLFGIDLSSEGEIERIQYRDDYKLI